MPRNQQQYDAIVRASDILQIADPAWLDALIAFETGGTFSPTIKNPNSSARGLIQIIDSSAQGIGYADSLDAVTQNPDFESQMENVVIPYLAPYAPFPTKQSLYMAVFYPAYRDAPLFKRFPYHVRKVNPGIVTVKDYINKVDGVASKKVWLFILGAAITATIIFGSAKNRRKNY